MCNIEVFFLFVCFSQIGQFFGVIDPTLMKTLVNSSLFTFKKTFDYQSLCDPKKESKAAAGLRSVYVVSYISQKLLTHNLPHTNTQSHPPVHTQTLMFTHVDSYTYIHFPSRTNVYKCKCACIHLSSYLLPRIHSQVPGAINPASADERASRGYGESV